MQKKLVSMIYLKMGKAVNGLKDWQPFQNGDAAALAEHYSNQGADAILVFDLSEKEQEHEQSLGLIREMARRVDIPLYGLGNINRAEDVKKLLYAGCRKAVLNFSKASNMAMLEEVSKRFGKDKISVCLDARKGEVPDEAAKARLEACVEEAVVMTDEFMCWKNREELALLTGMPVLLAVFGSEALSMEEKLDLLKGGQVTGLAEDVLKDTGTDMMEMKARLRAEGVEVNTFESAMDWSEFKTGADGLLPVIVQDYKTDEVLMEAYMNQEAYEATVRTGRMTYWSRSRQELWVKGMTSGHYQYVKELRIDCDCDTILARVAQIGAACHTGNRSCFYRTLMKKDYVERNPLRVFEEVYGVIEDRKIHPKEGSYTNYLFDKGIDKILKKVGEEAAEIIIAAKNPDPEEVKYEISDFLYHVMVLMVERGVTWEEIVRELADR